MGTCDGNACLTSASGCYLGTCQYYRDVYEHQPGAPTRTPGCSTGTQFPPPWKEGYGHDQAHVANGGTSRPDGMFVYSMVDNIHVPNAPGDYTDNGHKALCPLSRHVRPGIMLTMLRA